MSIDLSTAISLTTTNLKKSILKRWKYSNVMASTHTGKECSRWKPKVDSPVKGSMIHAFADCKKKKYEIMNNQTPLTLAGFFFAS